jgi:hypothetical protein
MDDHLHGDTIGPDGYAPDPGTTARDLARKDVREFQMPAKEKPSRRVRGFHHWGEAWYRDATRTPDEVDHIMVGIYLVEPDNGCEVEFRIGWERLGGSYPDGAPRVCIFSDSWKLAFSDEFADLFAALADRDHISPAEFCELLRVLGFEDLTAREDSDGRSGGDPDSIAEIRGEFVLGNGEKVAFNVLPGTGGNRWGNTTPVLGKVVDAHQAMMEAVEPFLGAPYDWERHR